MSQSKQTFKNKILAARHGEGPGCQGGAQQGTGARGEQYLDSPARSHIMGLRILFGTSSATKQTESTHKKNSLNRSPFFRSKRTDVSIRRSWFWSKATDFSVKKPEELLRIYENSVGRNAGLQLNIAPDKTGRIPERDLASLQQFGDLLRTYFATNLCSTTNAEINRTTDEQGRLTETIRFKAPTFVRYIVLHEDITKGQQIEAVDVNLTASAGKKFVYHATTVGWKRIIKTNAEAVLEIHVLVKQTRAAPHLTISAY